MLNGSVNHIFCMPIAHVMSLITNRSRQSSCLSDCRSWHHCTLCQWSHSMLRHLRFSPTHSLAQRLRYSVCCDLQKYPLDPSSRQSAVSAGPAMLGCPQRSLSPQHHPAGCHAFCDPKDMQIRSSSTAATVQYPVNCPSSRASPLPAGCFGADPLHT